MQPTGFFSNADLVAELHAAHASVTAAQRRLLEVIARCDRAEVYRDDGAWDLAHWLPAEIGMNSWTARRVVNAAHALARLPGLSEALETGTLSLDKAVELCRFATPEDEPKLIAWARRVTLSTVRHRADVATRRSREEAVETDRTRALRYWFSDDGRVLGLEGWLPADQGAVVARALDRLAGRLPDIVDQDAEPVSFESSLEARRADALVEMAGREIATDQDADRATVVVHADLDVLAGDDRGCEIEGGGVIHPETARRLSCDARLQVVLHDASGHAVGIGRNSRTVPPWLARQLRHLDRGCTFPGCGARRFLHAHHIKHWIEGGLTNLDNLCLVCAHHHKLLHEYGWVVKLGAPGTAMWFRPDGRAFDPGGRAPPIPELASA